MATTYCLYNKYNDFPKIIGIKPLYLEVSKRQKSKIQHTCKWPHAQAKCHTSHHSSRSQAAGHRDSDKAIHPHSGTQGSICTVLLHSKGSPDTQKIHCKPETCKGWLHHLKFQTNQKMMQGKAKNLIHLRLYQISLKLKVKSCNPMTPASHCSCVKTLKSMSWNHLSKLKSFHLL